VEEFRPGCGDQISQLRRRFEGKTVLVSGASSGIGAYAAKKLAAEGAKVGLMARNFKALHAVAHEIKRAGGRAVPVAADLCSSDQINSGVDELVERFGPVQHLIHCAADATNQVFMVDQLEENWCHTIDVNLNGAFRLCHSVVGGMVDRKEGTIVLVSSVAGLRGIASNTSYCAAKHGLIGLGRSLAMELGAFGIRVNSICPGIVDAPGTNDMTRYGEAFMNSLRKHHGPANLTWDRYLHRAINSTAMRRLISIKEVVNLSLFLLSHESEGITGQAISVDGGM
jgi:putative beta-ketoacyl reductase